MARGHGPYQHGPGIITSRNEPAIKREVDRVCALATGRENVCLGTGVLPYEAEPETVAMIQEYLKMKGKNSR